MRPPSCTSLFGLTALLGMALSGTIQAQLSDVTQPGDPIVPTSNNSPGSEGVANAIDNQPTKYLNFDKLNTGFTVTPSVGLSVVQCLTLTSANDAPERDPSSFVLSGSYDGTNFTQIASGSVPPFASRFQKVVIAFENNTPYLIYRLIFPTVANEAAANSMQIAEVELLGFLAPTDVTQPGDPIVPSSNNSPGSEGAANAIDNQPTKYLNFDKLNTGFTVTPAVGGTLVSGITLTSANDAPERDPASYTLEGSLDGTSFFPIASGAVPAFPSRFYKNYIFFPNARAYRAYRLIFPTVANAAAANSMQISEVELLGVVSDLPQDVTQPGDPIVASSNNTPGSEGVANAIDNQPTKYLNFDKLNTGFTVSPRAGLTIVSGLTLTSANDAPERDPASYVLSGSYDGSNFTQIANGTVPPFTNRFQTQTLLFDNKIPYLQYQLIFPTVANAAAANSMQIAEVQLLGVLAPTDVTVPGDPIVASSNNSPGSEGVANAIDNQPTKYLNFDRLNTGFTVTPSVGDTIVIGLTLTSANDAPERDPASYTLEGANDASNFVAIASGPVPVFPTRFFKNYLFFPDNTKSFKSYRLIFPTVAGPGGNSMQIAEVEFLGVTPGVINTNPVSNLIARQPVDTPVLLGSTATFQVGLTGPWKVQWYRNGVAIPGANNAAYTTPTATAGDDGSRFQALVQGRDGQQRSDEVMLSIFTPSTTESVGLSWQGSGANGAPTAMLPTDITGFQPQAYWNNLTGGSGTLTQPLNSSNQANQTITVSWATSGEWGVGTGNSDPTERMLNGMVTSFGTSEAAAQTVTFSGVPPGNHSLFLYTVQVPQEFFNMDFAAVTHDSGGNEVIQRRYIRPLNSDEYNPSPGFSLVTADTAANRGVGNMMRFDTLEPGPDGIIEVRFYSPGRVDLPGGDPIRGPGVNGMQLLLNPPPAGAPPIITRQPVSANGIVGGQITLVVEATGPGLAYQWLKNGQEIAGATGPQYTLATLRTNDAGNYSVIIRNPAGRVASRTAVVGVVASAQLTFGLRSYFKFDDDDSSFPTVANSAPGGLNGELNGYQVPDRPQHLGSSILFNGTDNYVLVTDYPKVSQAMTVAGWVLSESGQWGPIINNWVEGRTTGSSGQFLVEVVLENGVPTLQAQIEVGPNRVLATAALSFEQSDNFVWHHFAMSANGVTLSIYWDGVLLSTVDYLGTINATASLPWLSLGAALNGDPVPIPDPAVIPNLWSGALDDVALWNRSLSDLEVQGIYAGGLAGQSVSEVPPVLNTNVNNFPLAVDDSATTTQGVPVTIAVLANDSDPNGDTITVTSVTQPAHGTAVINAGTTVTYTPAAGYAGPDAFRYTISDGRGGIVSATVAITVLAVPPTITCPGNITAECAGGLTPVTYTVTAVDFTGAPVPVTCLPPSGAGFRLGTSNVTCTATDARGNSASCSFTVTVVDTLPPRVTCPADMTAQATSAAGAVVTYVASASDPCGIASFDCSPPSGSTFPVGVTPAVCRATDGSGNSNSCHFSITVISPNEPPVCEVQIPCSWTDSNTTYVIAANNSNACVVLDGSGSFDPDSDPLTYSWTVDGQFAVSLDPSQEPGAPGTGAGSGTVTLSGNTLTIHVTFAGLSANSTATHIHGPAAPGVNAAVLYPLNSIATLGGTAGTINGTVTLVDGVGGLTIAQQMQQLRSGLWYVNIHTTAHPGGEIRGQIESVLASGPTVTGCLDTGCHALVLVVSDGQATSRCEKNLCVITASEGVEQCIALVEATNVGQKNKRPLIASLKAASASFERDSTESGLNQLRAFQNKVRAQIAKGNPAEAAAMIQCVQQVIDAINCASP